MNNLYEMLDELKSRNIDKDRLVKFACDCALINIDLIEPCTENFEEIKYFLQSEASVRLSRGVVGRADFDADTSYYYAAYAAAYAAYADGADNDAAEASVYAALAAYADADADAYAACAASAVRRSFRVSSKSKAKVEELLKEMLDE